MFDLKSKIMARAPKKTTVRKPRPRKRTKKPSGFFTLKRVFLFSFLAAIVILSVFTAGYVIFFRTVFAG